jgi:arsenite methyltransferase
VLGWVAASPVPDRCAYAGAIGHSVYVAPGHRRRSIGAALLRAPGRVADAAGIGTIQTGVFPENTTVSVRLHHQEGFRTVGIRERIGCHHGRWRDVLLLERRSQTAGTG